MATYLLYMVYESRSAVFALSRRSLGFASALFLKVIFKDPHFLHLTTSAWSSNATVAICSMRCRKSNRQD